MLENLFSQVFVVGFVIRNIRERERRRSHIQGSISRIRGPGSSDKRSSIRIRMAEPTDFERENDVDWGERRND